MAINRLSYPELSEKQRKILWGKVKQGKNDECWEWAGPIQQDGRCPKSRRFVTPGNRTFPHFGQVVDLLGKSENLWQ